MRLCENESVEYYENSGNSLADLLRDAANTLDTLESYTLVSLNVSEGYDGDTYLVGMYVS